ncbi:MAG: hypothetical protein SOU02_10115, partial [Caecibacter massiliensis]|nr:hypothetical protein [Caecibacter massiliensis]
MNLPDPDMGHPLFPQRKSNIQYMDPYLFIYFIEFGWRTVFYVFAIPGIFLAVLWWLFVRDNPRDSRHVNEAEIHYIEH